MAPAMAIAERSEEDTAESEYQKGVKLLIEKGVNKVPKKYVFPACERPNTATNTEEYTRLGNKQNLQLPIIDFGDLVGPKRPQVLQSLAHACQHYGFFQVGIEYIDYRV